MQMMEEYEIGKDIICTSKMLRRTMDSRMPCEEVTGGQGRILGMIVEVSKIRNIYQRDIEAEFHIRRSSVTSILQLMEKKGWIIRESVPEDARLKRLVPTEKGIEVHNQVRNAIRQMEESMRNVMTEEERAVFRTVMEKIKTLITEQEGGDSRCLKH